MKKHVLFIVFSICTLNAQVGVGTTTPEGALDLNPTIANNYGFVVPRIALTALNAQAPVVNPQTGAIPTGTVVYNTATANTGVAAPPNAIGPGLYFWNGTRWVAFAGSPGGLDWSLLGNGSTNIATDFIGTTDAVDFATRTNNIERMRVLSNGRIAVNATTLSQVDNQFEVTSTIVGDDAITGIAVGTGGRGVQGNSTLDGIGVFGFNPDTGVGIFGSSATTGIGTYGNNSGTSTGVWGNNNNATASQDGFGIIGNVSSTTSTGVGVQGQIDSPTGNAIVGINNLGTAIMGQTIDPTQTSSTAAVYGTLDRTTNGGGVNQDISAVIGSTRSLNVGTGGYAGPLAAATNSSISGVAGSVASRVTTSTTESYLFGVIGDVLRDSSVGASTIPERVGGVLGYNGSNAWGVLGYKNSAGNGFGTYSGLIAANVGAGAGKSSSSNKTSNNGIGIGTTGGFMGGFIEGEQYGLISKGEEFGLYVTGNTITNSPIIKLTENNNERVATYVPTSTSIDINTRGKGKLSNGETFVTFDKNFIASASLDTENINITITPTGATNGVYIDRVTKTGFYVKENLKGTSNASFNWTAISTQKGFENGVSLSKEILANDFDKKMDGVMYNEADTTGEATPIHFDGNKVIFERMPDDIKNMKSDAPSKKLKKAFLPEAAKNQEK
jgi:hypothetical protein